MFGNKKAVLPPRPNPPNINEIVEDLKNTHNKNDIAFKLLVHESAYTDSVTSSESHDISSSYEKIKNYIETNKKLRLLKESINENEEKLESTVKSMLTLAEEIKSQAQAALIQ